MSQREERFEIDIEATPAEVWERLTTANGIASWFGTWAEIDLRIGGERTVGWGDATEFAARIASLEPETKLKLAYLADGEETGAEEWLISRQGTTTRLTLIFSMSDEGIDDWEGFFGDMRRGWQLFMASMRFGLTDARTPDRVVECVYFPALGSRDEIGVRVDNALADAEVVAGMEARLAIPPHSRLLTATDRSLLIDIEGSGEKQVLYVQAATHDGPARWRDETLAWAEKEFGDLSPA